MKNIICLSILCAALLGSFSTQAATVAVGDTARNNIRARAFNLDAYFDKAVDANILNSTSVPHATAQVTTSSGTRFDWFSFTVANANTNVLLDVDNTTGGLNTFLRLENAFGNLVATNNNSTSLDLGSSTLRDSFLNVVLESAGLYRVRIANRVGGSTVGLTAGQNYNLHVSMESPELNAVPVPAAIWLFGSALVGLVGVRGKKQTVLTA